MLHQNHHEDFNEKSRRLLIENELMLLCMVLRKYLFMIWRINMDCGFSETQFSFTIISEMVNKLTSARGWAMPALPSLRKEKKLGYDVKLAGPVNTLFLQFKVPKKLSKKKNTKHWSIYSSEYFVFKITPNGISPQHNNLVKLANRDSRFKVYYCAPAFIEESKLEEYYENKEIAKHSFFLNCKGLKKIKGNAKHSVSYRMEPTKKHKMHSEPIDIVGYDHEEFYSDILETEHFESLEECIKMISDELELGTDTNKSLEEQLEDIQTELIFKHNLHLFIY